jgi:small subunit ribosomal protein S27Ae
MAQYELYDEEGSTVRKQCPRCGDSFLADHDDRMHCGRCSYTEWK